MNSQIILFILACISYEFAHLTSFLLSIHLGLIFLFILVCIFEITLNSCIQLHTNSQECIQFKQVHTHSHKFIHKFINSHKITTLPTISQKFLQIHTTSKKFTPLPTNPHVIQILIISQSNIRHRHNKITHKSTKSHIVTQTQRNVYKL